MALRTTSLPPSNQDLFRKAINTAYRQLARRPCSRMEVEHRLQERDYPDPVIQRVIETLEEFRYLDDRAFARQWARDRLVHRHWGPLRLRIELQRKGVLKEWVEESIRELFDDGGEEEMAWKAIHRRLRASGLRDPRERRRCFAYLLRRGYSTDVIQAVFRRIERGVEPNEV